MPNSRLAFLCAAISSTIRLLAAIYEISLHSETKRRATFGSVRESRIEAAPFLAIRDDLRIVLNERKHASFLVEVSPHPMTQPWYCKA
jgi:hypothetical protein